MCVHDEPDDCEFKAVVQARVKNLDVNEDVTRKIPHTLETTGLWIFQSPQPPSNDNCNGFVEACGVEKIVTFESMHLGLECQHNAYAPSHTASPVNSHSLWDKLIRMIWAKLMGQAITDVRDKLA